MAKEKGLYLGTRHDGHQDLVSNKHTTDDVSGVQHS